MIKYLITGYAGFVGYHLLSLINAIEKEKVYVVGIDSIIPSYLNEEKWDNIYFEYKNIDLLDLEQVTSIINEIKPTYIINLAAFLSVGMSWKNPGKYFSNNLGILLNILEAVKDTNLCCTILNVGSSEEYGEVSKHKVILSEKKRLNPINTYGVTKMSQEYMSRMYNISSGINIISTRSFNHIGPRQRDVFVVSSFTKQVAEAILKKKNQIELITGNLEIVRDFIDVRDVANAYYHLLKNGKTGEVYNVCSGKGVKLQTIINELSKISGIKITAKLNKQLVRPNDIPVIIGSNKKIIKETEWKIQYTLQQSLIDMLDYWKKQLSNSICN